MTILGSFLLRRFSGQEITEEGEVYEDVENLVFDPIHDTVEVRQHGYWSLIRPVMEVYTRTDLPLIYQRCTARDVLISFAKPVKVIHRIEYQEVEIIPS